MAQRLELVSDEVAENLFLTVRQPEEKETLFRLNDVRDITHCTVSILQCQLDKKSFHSFPRLPIREEFSFFVELSVRSVLPIVAVQINSNSLAGKLH